MTKTDRVRVYYNIHKRCFSVQDYKTGLVIRHSHRLFLTNALFVVRKSGNERVRNEGKKNVHAFVNGIVVNRFAKIDNEFCFPVRYNPYTMDYFHYQRDVNNKLVWLPVDKHWIGNVTLNIVNDKPIIYADIDKLKESLPSCKFPKFEKLLENLLFLNSKSSTFAKNTPPAPKTR